MNKIVRKLSRRLMLEYCGAWLLVIITFILGETNIIPNGVFAAGGDSPTEFYLNTACIVLLLVGVPLALKLFSLNTKRGLRRMNKDEALCSYHLWSCVRLGLLLLCAETGLVAYFLLMNTTGLLCACMAMVMTLLCIPSIEKIQDFLKNIEEERAETVNMD